MKKPQLFGFPSAQLYGQKLQKRSAIWRKLAQAEVTLPFRKDYREFVSPALQEAGDRFLISLRSNHPKREPACVIDLPNILVYVTQRVFSIPRDERADVAILVEKNTGAYIVLAGEHEEASLSQGLKGFRLFLSKPEEEVAHIVGLWTDAFASIKEKYEDSPDYRQNVVNALIENMRPLEPEATWVKARFFQTFCVNGILPS